MAIVFDCYDSAGGLNFTSTAVTLAFDTTRTDEESAASVFTLSSNGEELTINDTGDFLFLYHTTCSFQTDTGDLDSYSLTVEVNTGSGFTAIAGTTVREGGNQSVEAGKANQTATGHMAIAVSSGDIFRLRLVNTNNALQFTTIAEGSGLTVYKLAPQISTLTSITNIDTTNDLLLIYDASAGLHKKVSVDTLVQSAATGVDKAEFMAQVVSSLAAVGAPVYAVSTLLASAANQSYSFLTGDPIGDAISFLKNQSLQGAHVPYVAKAIKGLIDGGGNDSSAFGTVQ